MVVADIDGEGAERAAGELARCGSGTATPAVVDVRDAGTVRALVDQVRDQHGRLDVMVNNAGIGVGGEADELTLAMTKHAVVGLSLSLRAEAAAHGVRVTAVRPGVVDTRSWTRPAQTTCPRPH